MLDTKYLQQLQFTPVPKATGVYALPHPRKPGSWYYVSTYGYFKNHKQSFFDVLARAGQKENPGQWDLHHVVEKQHLVSLYKPAELDLLYNNTWPCILIHTMEHRAYNSLLHSAATRIVFLNNGAPALKDVALLYQNAYTDNKVLKQIAANVIQDMRMHGKK